jgi:hypothetical protein
MTSSHICPNCGLAEFIVRLQTELYERYQLCEDGMATPSSILLAVTNAVAKVGSDMGIGPDSVGAPWAHVRAKVTP